MLKSGIDMFCFGKHGNYSPVIFLVLKSLVGELSFFELEFIMAVAPPVKALFTAETVVEARAEVFLSSA